MAILQKLVLLKKLKPHNPKNSRDLKSFSFQIVFTLGHQLQYQYILRAQKVIWLEIVNYYQEDRKWRHRIHINRLKCPKSHGFCHRIYIWAPQGTESFQLNYQLTKIIKVRKIWAPTISKFNLIKQIQYQVESWVC